MEKRVILGIVLTLLAVGILAAYIGQESQRQAAAAHRQRQEAVNRGAVLYATNCSACHGPRGQGLVGPAIIGSEYLEHMGYQEDDPSSLNAALKEMRKTIARGRPGTVMPAWAVEEGGPLNQEQILEIASFLLYGKEEDWQRAASLASTSTASQPTQTARPAESPTPSATPAPSTQPTQATPSAGGPDLVAQGRQLFQSKGCSACHGPNAEGGIGPALAGFSEAQITQQVRNPKGAMPPFPPDRLSDQEIKALAAFVESLTKQ
jgi:mono/diheme cytochrome c family protein